MELTVVPSMKKLGPVKRIHQSVFPTAQSSRISPPRTENTPFPARKCVVSALPFSRCTSLRSHAAGDKQLTPRTELESIEEFEIRSEALDDIPVPLPCR